MKPDNLPKTGPDLVSYAVNIAAYVRDHFTANNVALPEFERIAPGQLSLDAWDCEQFSVGTGGILDATGGTGTISSKPRTGNPYSTGKIRQVTYGIQIVRCVGGCTAQTPSNDAITEAGKQQLTDMALLSQALVNLASSPPDWAPEGVNADVGDVAPLGPSGLMYAIEASIGYGIMHLLPIPVP